MATLTTESRDAAAPNRFKQAGQRCDLVMKGGITSGVIYPQAVVALAERYRFRNIGGTSAGAIAAAVTAAAEYGRERDQAGFVYLEQTTIPQLIEPGFIRKLFQPSDETRPLLDGLLIYRDRQRARLQRAARSNGPTAPRTTSSLSKVGDALYVLWRAAVDAPAGPLKRAAVGGLAIGIVVAALFGAAAVLAGNPFAAAVLAALALAALLLGWPIGAAAGAWTLLSSFLPREHFYGICTGKGDNQALTNWLAQTIDTLAGLHDQHIPDDVKAVYGAIDELRGKHVPLTFRHLALNHQTEFDRTVAITLNMVTTNLSQGQPYTLPFTGGPFLFSKREFCELFPRDVVDFMIAISQANPPDKIEQPIGVRVPLGEDRAAAPTNDPNKDDELYLLPRGRDLPVVVATRMSLSFPGLLGAVPLWTISEAGWRRYAGAEQMARDTGEKIVLDPGDLQRNWFSDGGTCSNFPIHFYDRWFPSKPTFGINLETLPDWLFEKGSPPTDIAQEAPDYQQPYGLKPDVQQYRSAVREKDLVGAQNGPARPQAPWTLFEESPPTVAHDLVHLPSPARIDRPLPQWEALNGQLGSFVWSIIYTGLFYRDSVQARLPSYYDRIVTVYQSEYEGGLNLDMERAVVKDIAGRGGTAGAEVRRSFSFERHRWVRLRLLLAEMEDQIFRLRDSVLPPAGAAAVALDVAKDAAPLCPDQATSQGRLPWGDEQATTSLKQFRQAIEAAGLNHNIVRQLIECQVSNPQTFPYEPTNPWDDANADVTDRFLLLQLLIEMWAQQDASSEDKESSKKKDKTIFRDVDAPPRDSLSMRVAPDL